MAAQSRAAMRSVTFTAPVCHRNGLSAPVEGLTRRQRRHTPMATRTQSRGRWRNEMADAAKVTFKGNPVTLGGSELKAGARAPDFTAVDTGLQPVRVGDARGKVLILSAVPSLDTPVCDTETRRFNEEAGKLGGGVEVWTISMDLPFAQKRWCGAAGVTNVKTLSDFREHSFAQSYGVLVKDGPLTGLTARAVFVVGKDGKIKHVEYVKEITTEPAYEAALSAARQAASA